MRAPLAAAAGLAALLLAAVPAAASVDPSISVTPQRLTLGETATIRGVSWVVGAGCSAHVRVRIRIHGATAPVGSRRVRPSTAAFRLRFTPPDSKFPAGRATLIATQHCATGGDMVRAARLTLAH